MNTKHVIIHIDTFKIDRSRISLSDILEEVVADIKREEQTTTATVTSMERSAFVRGDRNNKQNKNSAVFKRHRTKRIRPNVNKGGSHNRGTIFRVFATSLKCENYLRTIFYSYRIISFAWVTTVVRNL